MHLVVLALGREGRERAGHLRDRGARRAQHVRRVLLQAHRVIRQSGAPCDVRRLVRSHLDVELGVGRVDRRLGGPQQGHGAVGGAAVVADRPRGAVVVEGRAAGAGEVVRQPEAVLQSCDQGEDLEGRTGLRGVLRRRVLRALQVVLAAVDRDDSAGLRVDGRQAHVHALGELRQLLDRLDGGLHRALVERRHDVVAAAVDLVLREAHGLELLKHARQQVPVLALVLVVLGLRVHLRHLCRGGLVLRDVPQLRHAVEHVPEAVLVGLGILRRVSRTGPLDHRGHECALRHVQLAGGLVEVVVGGDLDAVALAAQEDRVEVVRQDLVLRELLIDLERDEHLLDLAVQGALVREVEVLHVLLGDRRATTGVVIRDDAPHGAGQSLEGDAAVLVERLVLRCDRSLLHRLGDLVDRDVRAVLGGERPDLRLTVPVEHGRRLSGGLHVGLRDVRDRVPHAERAQSQRDEHQRRDRPVAERGDEAAPAGPTRTRVADPAREARAPGSGLRLRTGRSTTGSAMTARGSCMPGCLGWGHGVLRRR